MKTSTLFWLSLLLCGACGGAQSAPPAPPPAPADARATPATSSASPAPAPSLSVATAPVGMCVPAPPEAAPLMSELGSKPMAFGQRNGVRNDHTQLFRFLPKLHERYTVRTIVQTEGVGPYGPIFAVTLVFRNTPTSPMRAHLGFASAACAGGDLALLGAPVALDADDAIIAWAEPLPALPAPQDAPLTEVRVIAGKGPALDVFSYGPGDADTSFVVGAPRGKLGSPAERGSFGVLGRIDGLRRSVAPTAQSPEAREDRALTLRARLDAEGLSVDSERVGTAYVVAIPENQPTSAIYEDPLHRCRTGPEGHTMGYETAKAQWLYGLFPSKAAATARASSLGYKTGVVHVAAPRDAQPPGDAPSVIAASLPAAPGPLGCDLY